MYQLDRFDENQLTQFSDIVSSTLNIETLRKQFLQRKMQTNNFEWMQLNQKVVSFPTLGSPQKQKLTHQTESNSPVRKSYINNKKGFSHLRSKKLKKQMHKSKSEIDIQQLDNNNIKIRRRSEYDILSEKQIRLNIFYPNTFVQQHTIIRKNEIRKKSIFKRMSSILIKHSNTLKTQNSLVCTSSKNNDEIHDRLDEKSATHIFQQFKQQVGELKESEEFLHDMQSSEKYIQLQEELQKYSQSVNQSPKTKNNSKRFQSFRNLDQQKVVLEITKKHRKTFTSIQNYTNEKLLQPIGIIQSQIQAQYIQSLTETDSSSPLKFSSPLKLQSTSSIKPVQQIKSLSHLPEIKESISNRNFTTKNSKLVQSVKQLYISSPGRKKLNK